MRDNELKKQDEMHAIELFLIDVAYSIHIHDAVIIKDILEGTFNNKPNANIKTILDAFSDRTIGA